MEKSKKKIKKNKRKKSFWKSLGRFILHILKLPYYLVKGIIFLVKKASKKKKEIEIKSKRKSMVAKNEDFQVLKSISGDYENWLSKIYSSDSQIGIVIGARGSGKTAFGIKLLENLYSKKKKNCFSMGFNEKELPFWIKNVKEISEIENDSFVLIDEGGILFNSRSSMSNANKLLSKLIMIARHKNITIIFISQNSSNLEINILRQADFLILKPSSLLQKEFERKIIQKIYEESKDYFEKYSRYLGTTYIYSGKFKGFVSNPLPSFWKENLSKSFK
jgi:hypothetical protein